MTATSSGVRVSWRPRSTPVVASMISSGVVPRKAIAQVGLGVTGDLGPGVEGADQRRGGEDPADVVDGMPMTTASQSAVDPLGERARRSPAPR